MFAAYPRLWRLAPSAARSSPRAFARAAERLIPPDYCATESRDASAPSRGAPCRSWFWRCADPEHGNRSRSRIGRRIERAIEPSARAWWPAGKRAVLCSNPNIFPGILFGIITHQQAYHRVPGLSVIGSDRQRWPPLPESRRAQPPPDPEYDPPVVG